MDATIFPKRIILIALASSLPAFCDVALAHGGGHSGGSTGGPSSNAASSGHSSNAPSSGHSLSGSSNGHSKVGHSAADPSSPGERQKVGGQAACA